MLRYLPGLVLLQLVTLALFLANDGADAEALALRVGLPALALAAVTALWFRSLSRADGERDLARTRLEHERDRERERERLQRDAAREREALARQSERAHKREVRRTTRRAALQVGLAFAASGALGVLFVLSELVTLGLLTFATGGGALGGYLLRWRQTRVRSPFETAVPHDPRAAAEVTAETMADATFGPGPTGGAPSGAASPSSAPRLSAPGRRTESAGGNASWRSRL